jgi:hypothetical protein
MKAKWLLFISLVLFVLLTEICGAIPETINFQGQLTNRTTDEPVNGTVSIVFRFYNAATGGNLLWEETQSVQVTNGFYSTALGSVTPFNLPFDQQYFLELEVNSDGPMSPRYALASSPYTLNAKKVGGYEVSETPQANTLLPLDASARFPSSVIPPVSNADMVDNFHASSTPTPGYLLPLNASGLLPSSVIPLPVSNADMVDNARSEVKVTVTDSGSEQFSASVWVTDDQLPPQFTALGLARIEGTVSDPTVTVVTVNGEPVTVTGGTFSYQLSEPYPTQVTVEATNTSGQTVQRVVQIVR